MSNLNEKTKGFVCLLIIKIVVMAQKVLFQFKLPMDGFNKLPTNFELVIPDENTFSDENFETNLKNADALVSLFGQKVTPTMMDMAPKLKLIANYGVGYDNIEVNYATKKGILVTNTPDTVTEPTAELAMGLIVSLARNIALFNNNLRQKKIPEWTVLNNLSTTLYGKTLGIVGMGAIGKSLARRALSFGMNIIYHNRNRLDTNIEQKYNANYTNLESLLRSSDVVSINVPRTEDTFHLIGISEFKIMKPNAIFINTARGSIVDELALINALKNKEIAAAGLDVFENEPQIPSELLQMENVIVTPHVGSATYETRAEMSTVVASVIENFFDGNKSIPAVNTILFNLPVFRGKELFTKTN